MTNSKYNRLYKYLEENGIEYKPVYKAIYKSQTRYRIKLKDTKPIEIYTCMGFNRAIDMMIKEISFNL